jgi:hypothetical protein
METSALITLAAVMKQFPYLRHTLDTADAWYKPSWSGNDAYIYQKEL